MDFRKKRKFSFFVFCRFKKKTVGSKCYPLPHHPRWREEFKWTGEKERKTQREMVEVGRDLKGRETKVRRWMRDRFLQNNFILYIWQLKLFYFYLSVNCLWLIFFCCLICVDFFLLSFVFWGFFVCLFFLLYFTLFFFVNFGGLSLPCHLLCCLLLFVFFFLFIHLFFYLHGFSGFIFCKCNCSWNFFTSSDRVPPGGLVARGPRFGDWYRGVVSNTNDDLGKRVGWLRWIDGYGTKETVDDGLGERCLGAGRCPVAPPPWLDDLGDGVNCFVFFLSFENPWGLMAGWKSVTVNFQ